MVLEDTTVTLRFCSIQAKDLLEDLEHEMSTQTPSTDELMVLDMIDIADWSPPHPQSDLREVNLAISPTGLLNVTCTFEHQHLDNQWCHTAFWDLPFQHLKSPIQPIHHDVAAWSSARYPADPGPRSTPFLTALPQIFSADRNLETLRVVRLDPWDQSKLSVTTLDLPVTIPTGPRTDDPTWIDESRGIIYIFSYENFWKLYQLHRFLL